MPMDGKDRPTWEELSGSDNRTARCMLSKVQWKGKECHESKMMSHPVSLDARKRKTKLSPWDWQETHLGRVWAGLSGERVERASGGVCPHGDWAELTLHVETPSSVTCYPVTSEPGVQGWGSGSCPVQILVSLHGGWPALRALSLGLARPAAATSPGQTSGSVCGIVKTGSACPAHLALTRVMLGVCRQSRSSWEFWAPPRDGWSLSP